METLTTTPEKKAKELQSQFKDHAKYVCREIIDELKREYYTNYERIVFWNAVKIKLSYSSFNIHISSYI